MSVNVRSTNSDASIQSNESLLKTKSTTNQLQAGSSSRQQSASVGGSSQTLKNVKSRQHDDHITDHVAFARVLQAQTYIKEGVIKLELPDTSPDFNILSHGIEMVNSYLGSGSQQLPRVSPSNESSVDGAYYVALQSPSVTRAPRFSPQKRAKKKITFATEIAAPSAPNIDHANNISQIITSVENCIRILDRPPSNSMVSSTAIQIASPKRKTVVKTTSVTSPEELEGDASSVVSRLQQLYVEPMQDSSQADNVVKCQSSSTKHSSSANEAALAVQDEESESIGTGERTDSDDQYEPSGSEVAVAATEKGNENATGAGYDLYDLRMEFQDLCGRPKLYSAAMQNSADDDTDDTAEQVVTLTVNPSHTDTALSTITTSSVAVDVNVDVLSLYNVERNKAIEMMMQSYENCMKILATRNKTDGNQNNDDEDDDKQFYEEIQSLSSTSCINDGVNEVNRAEIESKRAESFKSCKTRNVEVAGYSSSHYDNGIEDSHIRHESVNMLAAPTISTKKSTSINLFGMITQTNLSSNMLSMFSSSDNDLADSLVQIRSLAKLPANPLQVAGNLQDDSDAEEDPQGRIYVDDVAAASFSGNTSANYYYDDIRNYNSHNVNSSMCNLFNLSQTTQISGSNSYVSMLDQNLSLSKNDENDEVHRDNDVTATSSRESNHLLLSVQRKIFPGKKKLLNTRMDTDREDVRDDSMSSQEDVQETFITITNDKSSNLSNNIRDDNEESLSNLQTESPGADHTMCMYDDNEQNLTNLQTESQGEDDRMHIKPKRLLSQPRLHSQHNHRYAVFILPRNAISETMCYLYAGGNYDFGKRNEDKGLLRYNNSQQQIRYAPDLRTESTPRLLKNHGYPMFFLPKNTISESHCDYYRGNTDPGVYANWNYSDEHQSSLRYDSEVYSNSDYANHQDLIRYNNSEQEIRITAVLESRSTPCLLKNNGYPMFLLPKNAISESRADFYRGNTDPGVYANWNYSDEHQSSLRYDSEVYSNSDYANHQDLIRYNNSEQEIRITAVLESRSTPCLLKNNGYPMFLLPKNAISESRADFYRGNTDPGVYANWNYSDEHQSSLRYDSEVYSNSDYANHQDLIRYNNSEQEIRITAVLESRSTPCLLKNNGYPMFLLPKNAIAESRADFYRGNTDPGVYANWNYSDENQSSLRYDSEVYSNSDYANHQDLIRYNNSEQEIRITAVLESRSTPCLLKNNGYPMFLLPKNAISESRADFYRGNTDPGVYANWNYSDEHQSSLRYDSEVYSNSDYANHQHLLRYNNSEREMQNTTVLEARSTPCLLKNHGYPMFFLPKNTISESHCDYYRGNTDPGVYANWNYSKKYQSSLIYDSEVYSNSDYANYQHLLRYDNSEREMQNTTVLEARSTPCLLKNHGYPMFFLPKNTISESHCDYYRGEFIYSGDNFDNNRIGGVIQKPLTCNESFQVDNEDLNKPPAIEKKSLLTDYMPLSSMSKLSLSSLLDIIEESTSHMRGNLLQSMTGGGHSPAVFRSKSQETKNNTNLDLTDQLETSLQDDESEETDNDEVESVDQTEEEEYVDVEALEDSKIVELWEENLEAQHENDNQSVKQIPRDFSPNVFESTAGLWDYYNSEITIGRGNFCSLGQTSTIEGGQENARYKEDGYISELEETRSLPQESNEGSEKDHGTVLDEKEVYEAEQNQVQEEGPEISSINSRTEQDDSAESGGGSVEQLDQALITNEAFSKQSFYSSGSRLQGMFRFERRESIHEDNEGASHSRRNSLIERRSADSLASSADVPIPVVLSVAPLPDESIIDLQQQSPMFNYFFGSLFGKSTTNVSKHSDSKYFLDEEFNATIYGGNTSSTSTIQSLTAMESSSKKDQSVRLILSVAERLKYLDQSGNTLVFQNLKSNTSLSNIGEQSQPKKSLSSNINNNITALEDSESSRMLENCVTPQKLKNDTSLSKLGEQSQPKKSLSSNTNNNIKALANSESSRMLEHYVTSQNIKSKTSLSKFGEQSQPIKSLSSNTNNNIKTLVDSESYRMLENYVTPQKLKNDTSLSKLGEQSQPKKSLSSNTNNNIKALANSESSRMLEHYVTSQNIKSNTSLSKLGEQSQPIKSLSSNTNNNFTALADSSSIGMLEYYVTSVPERLEELHATSDGIFQGEKKLNKATLPGSTFDLNKEFEILLEPNNTLSLSQSKQLHTNVDNETPSALGFSLVSDKDKPCGLNIPQVVVIKPSDQNIQYENSEKIRGEVVVLKNVEERDINYFEELKENDVEAKFCESSLAHADDLVRNSTADNYQYEPRMFVFEPVHLVSPSNERVEDAVITTQEVVPRGAEEIYLKYIKEEKQSCPAQANVETKRCLSEANVNCNLDCCLLTELRADSCEEELFSEYYLQNQVIDSEPINNTIVLDINEAKPKEVRGPVEAGLKDGTDTIDECLDDVKSEHDDLAVVVPTETSMNVATYLQDVRHDLENVEVRAPVKVSFNDGTDTIDECLDDTYLGDIQNELDDLAIRVPLEASHNIIQCLDNLQAELDLLTNVEVSVRGTANDVYLDDCLSGDLDELALGLSVGTSVHDDAYLDDPDELEDVTVSAVRVPSFLNEFTRPIKIESVVTEHSFINADKDYDEVVIGGLAISKISSLNDGASVGKGIEIHQMVISCPTISKISSSLNDAASVRKAVNGTAMVVGLKAEIRRTQVDPETSTTYRALQVIDENHAANLNNATTSLQQGSVYPPQYVSSSLRLETCSRSGMETFDGNVSNVQTSSNKQTPQNIKLPDDVTDVSANTSMENHEESMVHYFHDTEAKPTNSTSIGTEVLETFEDGLQDDIAQSKDITNAYDISRDNYQDVSVKFYLQEDIVSAVVNVQELSSVGCSKRMINKDTSMETVYYDVVEDKDLHQNKQNVRNENGLEENSGLYENVELDVSLEENIVIGETPVPHTVLNNQEPSSVEYKKREIKRETSRETVYYDIADVEGDNNQNACDHGVIKQTKAPFKISSTKIVKPDDFKNSASNVQEVGSLLVHLDNVTTSQQHGGSPQDEHNIPGFWDYYRSDSVTDLRPVNDKANKVQDARNESSVEFNDTENIAKTEQVEFQHNASYLKEVITLIDAISKQALNSPLDSAVVDGEPLNSIKVCEESNGISRLNENEEISEQKVVTGITENLPSSNAQCIKVDQKMHVAKVGSVLKYAEADEDKSGVQEQLEKLRKSPLAESLDNILKEVIPIQSKKQLKDNDNNCTTSSQDNGCYPLQDVNNIPEFWDYYSRNNSEINLGGEKSSALQVTVNEQKAGIFPDARFVNVQELSEPISVCREENERGGLETNKDALQDGIGQRKDMTNVNDFSRENDQYVITDFSLKEDIVSAVVNVQELSSIGCKKRGIKRDTSRETVYYDTEEDTDIQHNKQSVRRQNVVEEFIDEESLDEKVEMDDSLVENIEADIPNIVLIKPSGEDITIATFLQIEDINQGLLSIPETAEYVEDVNNDEFRVEETTSGEAIVEIEAKITLPTDDNFITEPTTMVGNVVSNNNEDDEQSLISSYFSIMSSDRQQTSHPQSPLARNSNIDVDTANNPVDHAVVAELTEVMSAFFTNGSEISLLTNYDQQMKITEELPTPALDNHSTTYSEIPSHEVNHENLSELSRISDVVVFSQQQQQLVPYTRKIKTKSYLDDIAAIDSASTMSSSHHQNSGVGNTVPTFFSTDPILRDGHIQNLMNRVKFCIDMLGQSPEEYDQQQLHPCMSVSCESVGSIGDDVSSGPSDVIDYTGAEKRFRSRYLYTFSPLPKSKNIEDYNTATERDSRLKFVARSRSTHSTRTTLSLNKSDLVLSASEHSILVRILSATNEQLEAKRPTSSTQTVAKQSELFSRSSEYLFKDHQIFAQSPITTSNSRDQQHDFQQLQHIMMNVMNDQYQTEFQPMLSYAEVINNMTEGANCSTDKPETMKSLCELLGQLGSSTSKQQQQHHQQEIETSCSPTSDVFDKLDIYSKLAENLVSWKTDNVDLSMSNLRVPSSKYSAISGLSDVTDGADFMTVCESSTDGADLTEILEILATDWESENKSANVSEAASLSEVVDEETHNLEREMNDDNVALVEEVSISNNLQQHNDPPENRLLEAQQYIIENSVPLYSLTQEGNEDLLKRSVTFLLNYVQDTAQDHIVLPENTSLQSQMMENKTLNAVQKYSATSFERGSLISQSGTIFQNKESATVGEYHSIPADNLLLNTQVDILLNSTEKSPVTLQEEDNFLERKRYSSISRSGTTFQNIEPATVGEDHSISPDNLAIKSKENIILNSTEKSTVTSKERDYILEEERYSSISQSGTTFQNIELVISATSIQEDEHQNEEAVLLFEIIPEYQPQAEQSQKLRFANDDGNLLQVSNQETNILQMEPSSLKSIESLSSINESEATEYVQKNVSLTVRVNDKATTSTAKTSLELMDAREDTNDNLSILSLSTTLQSVSISRLLLRTPIMALRKCLGALSLNFTGGGEVNDVPSRTSFANSVASGSFLVGGGIEKSVDDLRYHVHGNTENYYGIMGIPDNVIIDAPEFLHDVVRFGVVFLTAEVGIYYVTKFLVQKTIEWRS